MRIASAYAIASLYLIVLGCRTEQRAHATVAAYPRSAVADSLLAAGSTVYDDAEYDSAESILNLATERAKADGDSLTLAKAQTKIALAQFHLGQYADAKKLGEAALALKLRGGMKQEYFRSYNALGLLAYTTGRYGDAAALFAQARAAADSLNDSASVAKAVGNLGLVHTDVGRFDDARQEYDFLLRTASANGDTISEGNALANLGMLSIRAGDAGSAIQLLEHARAVYASKDYAPGQEMVFGQLGSAYSELGDPQRAIAYMDSALTVARKHDMRREEAEDTEIFAELFGSAGDHLRALKFLNGARLLADSVGLEARSGDIARAEARELAVISSVDRALARANDAAEIHRKAGDPVNELEDRLLFAEIAEQGHRSQLAGEQLSRAENISVSLRLPVASEKLAIGSARVADLAQDPTRVLRSLPAELTFPHLGYAIAGEADAMRARAFARLRQWPEAVNAGRKAINAFSMVRGRLGEGALRAAYTSDKSDVYADLVVALLQLGRTDEAFEVADEARGKALLEHLNAVRNSARTTSRDLSDADELLRRIDYLTERLRLADTVPTPERSLSLRNDLRDLSLRLAQARTEYETRINTIARADPRGAAVLGVTPSDIRDIQRVLRPDEMVVEYLLSPNRLFIFAASRDTIAAMSRPVRLEDLESRVRHASQQVATSHANDAGSPALRGLYDLLIAPVDLIPAAGRATRLIIVPHSTLTYLPFAALLDHSGHALVERRALLMLQSASALPFIRRTYAFDAQSFSVFAPFPNELSGTLAEARLVMGEVAKPRSFIGSRGTEQQLRSMLEREGNVHVASHALLNQTNPMFSHVELAPGPGEDPANDGRLDVHELLRMNVRSNLVYLSGCETGAGAAWSNSFRTAQDYATLSQALLFAGAQNVVATLWRIDDAGASVFAGRFYHALRSGDVVDALAAAQRQTLKDPRYASPRYWAGYTVSGSGISKPVSQNIVRSAVQ